MIRAATEITAEGAARALLRGLAVWVLDTGADGSPPSLHCGSEQEVRAAWEHVLSEPWPEVWTLRPLSAGRAEAALADARAEVLALDAERDRLAARVRQLEELARGPAPRPSVRPVAVEPWGLR